jgi:transcriptional regulator with XRE-family HTH domain
VNIEQALNKAISAKYKVTEPKSPISSRRGLTARMRGLEKSAGGKKAAAAKAGVSISTWNRWLSGKQKPSGASLAKLGKAHQAAQRGEKTGAKRAPKTTFRVVAAAEIEWGKKGKAYYNPTRQRSVRFGDMDMGPVVQAWVNGEPLEPAFMGVVKDYHQADVSFHGDQADVDLT